MSKKAVPDNFMESFISGKDPEKANNHPTKAPQTPHERPTKRPRTGGESTTNTPLKKYHIRMAEGDYETLKEYFEDQGITVSAGIRQALRAFMRKEGLR